MLEYGEVIVQTPKKKMRMT